MFNKGFSQETKEEAWSVEFYRDNSQEITGKGDEFRVFATVLSAIQTFISDRVPGAIGKYKPNKVYFSASKQVEPGQKEQSRAGLYDSLVQRYARALGFTSSRSDTGNKVMYELNRIKPAVAESTGYIPINDREARDPRYSMAITQDIRPGEVQRQAAKMGFKTDAAGVPPLLMKLQICEAFPEIQLDAKTPNTRSPIFQSSTSSPIPTISPAASLHGTIGNL
jgi:hypothetical protein